MMRTTLGIITTAALFAAACSDDDVRRGAEPTGDTGADTPTIVLSEDDIRLTSGLVRFDDCGALLDHLRQEYAARVGPWGFNDGNRRGPGFDEDMADDDAEGDTDDTDADVVEAAMSEGAAPVEGVDFSGTSVQERGVDEADIVKTDGRRIFALSQGRLVVVDARERQVTGSVQVAEGWSSEMLLHGDSVLLIVRGPYDQSGHGPQTVLQRIEVRDGQPSVVATLRAQGDYLSARSVGGIARVVMRYDPQHNFPFVFPRNEAGEDAAQQANRDAILNSTLDDWIPRYTLGSRPPSQGDRLTRCADVHAPTVFSGFGLTTVMSVAIDGDLIPSSSTAVTAPGDTVYASTDSLYVTTTRWLDATQHDGDDAAWERAWRDLRTSVHRFSLDASGSAAYEASGDVPGTVHNQFSLSEHEGRLRVVTTVGHPWFSDSESYLRVIEQHDDRLIEIGNVGGIGRGEDVQSVRFVGDIAYVVTFREIDPFYIVDLSDPAAPRVTGELKIPGFSSYLHPIGDDLVLGVGADADATGFVTGSKVSLFDVSDAAAPREIDVWTIADTRNDIGWDHHGFLWWAPERIAVIPMTAWRGFSGAVVLRVENGSLREASRIEHADDPAGGATDCRYLTAGDLPSDDYDDFTTELEFLVMEGLGFACDPDESAPPGLDCVNWSVLHRDGRDLDLLQAGESVWVCWQNAEPQVIYRSMVIGSELWTLGAKGHDFDTQRKHRLEVHDLASLTRLSRIDL